MFINNNVAKLYNYKFLFIFVAELMAYYDIIEFFHQIVFSSKKL